MTERQLGLILAHLCLIIASIYSVGGEIRGSIGMNLTSFLFLIISVLYFYRILK